MFPYPAEPALGEDDHGGTSLSRQAFHCLREQIVTLKLPPGAPLHEPVLMEELGLGRTPIREALQWLACQGLVVLQPRRGAFVAHIGMTDLQQICELRQELEGYAAALVAERATEDEIARLEQLLAGLDETGSTQAHLEVDRAFHDALARSTHNKFLRSSVSRLYYLNLRLWYLVLDRIGPIYSAVEQHRAVVTAIKEHDSQKARAIIGEHIADFHKRVRAVI